MSMFQQTARMVEALSLVLRDRVCSWCAQNPVSLQAPVCLHCVDALLCAPHWVRALPPPGLGGDVSSHEILGLCRFSTALKRVSYRHKFASRPHWGDVRAWTSRFQLADLAAVGLSQAMQHRQVMAGPTLVFPIPPRAGSRRVGVPLWALHVARLLSAGGLEHPVTVVPAGLAWNTPADESLTRQAPQHCQPNRRARWLNVHNRLILSPEGLAACAATPQPQVWVVDDLTTTGATLMAATQAVATGLSAVLPEQPCPCIVPIALMSIPNV